MNLNVPGAKWHAKTLRAWQLAVLRVTLDNADRLAVLAIAGESDALGPKHDSKPDFGFFRRTSTELCSAILRPNELSSAVLRQYPARIDDDRLKRVLWSSWVSTPTTSPTTQYLTAFWKLCWQT